MGCASSLVAAAKMKTLLLATYGSKDVTEKVKEHASEEPKLQIEILPSKYVEVLGGDPNVNEYKDFALITVDFEKKTQKVNVFYDDDKCALTLGEKEPPGDDDLGGEISAQAILIANYGGKDITKEIQELFASKSRVEITEPHKTYSTAMYGQDPMKDIKKAFFVVYKYTYGDGIPYNCANWWFDGETIIINKLLDDAGAHHICVAGGTNQALHKHLSCRPDGHVDLYSHDDTSGRQLWTLRLLPHIGPNVYNILVQGG